MAVAICSRAALLGTWRKAFPEGRICAALPATSGKDEGGGLLWLHAERRDAAGVGEWVADALRRIPHARIVVMSDAPEQVAALHALNQGARGYCHAQAAPDLLRQIGVVVGNGGMWIGPELMQRVLGSVNALLDSRGAPSGDSLSALTPRERAVAMEVSKGATNKEVARRLGITERTVKAHLAATFEKLGVRDRLELVIRVRESATRLARSVA
ncbi:MAG: response regulator transcription factor [Rhodocyclaceae bacterium]|nr:response regulator transcription factor [Rhodocyclaceae bacterium]